MKKISFLLGIISIVLLTGCESTGWRWSGAPDIFTPGASVETKVRTWDKNGNPQEQTVKNEPAYLYNIQQ